jgi:glycosyltransferase involved in cell wall biosynthesis
VTLNIQDDVRCADRPFVPVVVLPTYNNAQTLCNVLDRVWALGLPMLVVNDGSTDQTPALLEQWSSTHRGRVHILTQARNRGKAAALRTGFAQSQALGYTHAVTVDTDGQLDPEEIPGLLNLARQSPGSLILGWRDDQKADYPGKSRLGRRLSNLAIWLECGQRVTDSQCGFRVYPLDLAAAVRCRSGRFGYETEIITRAAWAGYPLCETPVTCRYFAGEKRVTHFKIVRDTLRHLGLHARLIARTLWPWFPKRTAENPGTTTAGGRQRWRDVARRISIREFWLQLKEHPENRSVLAAGLAMGVFVANLPAYGFQTLLGLYLARRLHLNPLAVVLGTHFSTPPIGPALVGAAVWVGHLFMTGGIMTLADLDIARHGTAAVVGRMFLEWVVGGILLGVVFGVLCFAGSLLVLRWVAAKPSPPHELFAMQDGKLSNSSVHVGPRREE